MKPRLAFMNLPISNQLIDIGSLVVLALIALGTAYKIRHGSFRHFNHWYIFGQRVTKGESTRTEISAVLATISTVLLKEVLAVRVLGTCNKAKRYSHISIFWGFVFLAVSTILAFFTNPTNGVLPLSDPVKIFGNAGGIFVVAGFVGMFSTRRTEGGSNWQINRSDLFLITLLLAVLTGFLAQQTIYSESIPLLVSGTFWVHMAFVIILLATAPFTKFFHALSKPVSLLRDEMDKKRGAESLLPNQKSRTN